MTHLLKSHEDKSKSFKFDKYVIIFRHVVCASKVNTLSKNASCKIVSFIRFLTSNLCLCPCRVILKLQSV